jgi:hypothetical protein
MRRGWGASLIKECETRKRLARNDIEAVVVQRSEVVVHKPRVVVQRPNLGSWSKSEVVVQIGAVVVQRSEAQITHQIGSPPGQKWRKRCHSRVMMSMMTSVTCSLSRARGIRLIRLKGKRDNLDPHACLGLVSKL